MEKLSGNIRGFLVNNKLLQTTTVTIGFKYECNWFVLQKLARGQPCMCAELAYASENTCIAYSIYESIREKLLGSPLEQLKSKVSAMACNYQNGEFIITFSCSNNLTSVQKNLILSISKITPHKYYRKYSHNIKLLNGKPSKKEFIYSSNLLVGKTINVFILGKFNITPDKFSNIIEKTSAKYVDVKSHPGGVSPHSLNKSQGHTSYPTNIADGYKAVFVRDFITGETGFTVVIHSGVVIVYNKEWEGLSKKVTPSAVDKYVVKKYAKLGAGFIPMVLYMTSLECSLDIDNMIKLYNDNPSPVVVSGYIKKAL